MIVAAIKYLSLFYAAAGFTSQIFGETHLFWYLYASGTFLRNTQTTSSVHSLICVSCSSVRCLKSMFLSVKDLNLAAVFKTYFQTLKELKDSKNL